MTHAKFVAAIILLLAVALPFNAAAAEPPGEIPNAQSPLAGWTPPVATGSHAVTAADYPVASIILGEEGRTLLKLLVRTDGTVVDVVVQETSGYARLDEAAATLVKRWRYRPATHDGRPAEMWIRAVIVWQLTGMVGDPADAPGFPVAIIVPEPGDYPQESRAADEAGVTLLMIVIDEKGTIGTVFVFRSSGHPRLDQAAMTLALTKWHPQPATMQGKPIKTVLLLAVRWALPR